MDLTSISNIILVTCASVTVTTVVMGCTFCIRYLTSTGLSATEPVSQAKKTALRLNNQKDGSSPPNTTIVQMTPEEEVKVESMSLGDDIERTYNNDVRYFSDAYSWSDVTTSPGESPMTSPLSTPSTRHKPFFRMNSVGTLPYQPSVTKVSEGEALTLPNNERSSIQGDLNLHSYGSMAKQKRRSFGMKRSISVPEIREHFKPQISFDIKYDDKKYCLVISEVKALNLGMFGGRVDVKMQLCPTDKTVHTESLPVPVDGNVTFDLELRFDDLNEFDLYRLSLLVTLSHGVKDSKKKATLGEVLLKVTELGVKAGSLVKVTRSLHHRRRVRKKSTSSSCLLRELGDLFVTIQYQSHASRFKVLVRKASGLPSGGKLPGQPDHFVVVDLRRGDQSVGRRETRPQKGKHPVWNEPFLFDITGAGDDVDEFSLEFTLRRGRIYTKDNVLGHALVGPHAPSGGKAHWAEAVSPLGAEVARWHPILPVFKY